MQTPVLHSVAAAAAALLAISTTAAPAQSPAASPTVPRGALLAANQQSASATITMLPERTSVQVAVGAGPHEAAIGPDGTWGVVTVYGTQVPGSRLALLDLTSGALVKHVELGEYTRPHGVVVLPGPGRRVVVTSESTRNLVVVDMDAGRVDFAIATGSPGSHMVAVTADGRRAFTANIAAGSISEFDLTARRLVRSDSISTVTEGVAVTPDGREVWVGSNNTGRVSVFDTRAGRVVATLDGFRMPYRIGISPDGSIAAIPDPPANVLHVVDIATRTTLGSIDVGGSPRGVAISADSRTAFVTLGPENAVVIVDLGSRTVIGRTGVGTHPDGIAFVPVP